MREYWLFWKNYMNFAGRSTRREYWMSSLWNAGIVAALMYCNMKQGALYWLYLFYVLALVIPGLSLSVRRLHDIGKSGGNVLWNLLPFVGAILYFLWMIKAGQPCENRYGPDPYAGERGGGVEPPPQPDTGSEGSGTREARPSDGPVCADSPNNGAASSASSGEKPKSGSPAFGVILGVLVLVLLVTAGSSFSKLKAEYGLLQQEHLEMEQKYQAMQEETYRLNQEMTRIGPVYRFLYDTAVVIPDETWSYHRADCGELKDMKSCLIFNEANAKRLGYRPCPECIKETAPS